VFCAHLTSTPRALSSGIAILTATQRMLQAAMVLGNSEIGVLDTTQVHQPSPPSQPFIVES
jgi:hypothetical protein